MPEDINDFDPGYVYTKIFGKSKINRNELKNSRTDYVTDKSNSTVLDPILEIDSKTSDN